MLRCANCGRESPDDARFCAGCGASLAEPELLGLLRFGRRDTITDAWVVDLAFALKALGRESEVLAVIQAPTP
jgi:zinc-ribbon domain